MMSGLENITDHVGSYGVAGEQIFGKKADRAVIPTNAGRDPKGMCGAADPFDLSSGLGNGRGYQSGRAHGGAGHSRTGENGGFNLGGFVRDVLTGAVTGGLGSAGFYGAGKAVDALWGSVAGRRRKKLSVGDAIFMDANDSFAKYISRREDVDVRGYYDVIAHGQTDGILITHNGQHMLVNHRTAARLIQQADGYKGQDIRLLSCNTGAANVGFAQNLANRLNVKVYAPTNYLWATPSGEYFVAGMNKFALPNRKNIGKFKLFMPGGNQNGM